jgi:hypothetical protein
MKYLQDSLKEIASVLNNNLINFRILYKMIFTKKSFNGLEDIVISYMEPNSTENTLIHRKVVSSINP